MRKATFGVGRGVWVSPWLSRDGNIVLVAVQRDERCIAERELRPGDGRVQAAEELWETLDREDPVPNLQVIG